MIKIVENIKRQYLWTDFCYYCSVTERKDIYNLKDLAKLVKFSNAYQRLNYVFKDVDLYIDNEMLQETIDALEKEHKETVKRLKGKMKK